VPLALQELSKVLWPHIDAVWNLPDKPISNIMLPWLSGSHSRNKELAGFIWVIGRQIMRKNNTPVGGSCMT